mmetsp:Transcript_98102/g.316360  ORF Transcript_98102/g.316360 Transcript_98102/m.316360 type:complete len:214 (+) Transcript_98102:60-701(+)
MRVRPRRAGKELVCRGSAAESGLLSSTSDLILIGLRPSRPAACTRRCARSRSASSSASASCRRETSGYVSLMRSNSSMAAEATASTSSAATRSGQAACRSTAAPTYVLWQMSLGSLSARGSDCRRSSLPCWLTSWISTARGMPSSASALLESRSHPSEEPSEDASELLHDPSSSLSSSLSAPKPGPLGDPSSSCPARRSPCPSSPQKTKSYSR